MRAAAKAIQSAKEEFAGPDSETNWWWVLPEAEGWTSMLLGAPTDPGLARWLKGLTPDKHLLVACALAIVEHLKIPDDELIPLLQKLRTMVARA